MINKQLVRQVLSTLRDDEVTTYKQALHTCGGWGADTPSEAGLLR